MPTYRSGGGFTLRPNAPRMITCVVAVLLTVAGLSVVLPIPALEAQLTELGMTRDHGFIALVASPLLLVAGSFMRGL